MNSNWTTRTVADLVTLGVLDRPLDGNHGGIHPKGADFIKSGIPFIVAADLKDGRVNLKSCAFISEAQSKTLRKGFAVEGDILLSHKATIGRTAIVERLPDGIPYLVLSPQVTYYRVLDENVLDRSYLRYYFDSRTFQQIIQAWAGAGSTRAYIGITQQLGLPISFPHIDEQRRIARILGTLDQKIDLCRRMNETLDGILVALFKSWLVDFDIVHAKRKTDYVASDDSEFNRRFPAEFEHVKSGDIPKGWRVRSLDEIADYLNGLALQKYPPRNGNTLPVIKIAQLRKGDTEGADLCSAELPPQFIVNDGDVLFSWSGSLEVELWGGGAGALNQHLFRVTSMEFPKWFYFLWTRHHLEDFRRTAAGKATTMGHIQRHHLSAAKVLIPSSDLLAAMSKVMSPLLEKIISNRKQERMLTQIRDTLLPKLVPIELSPAEAGA